MTKLKCEKCRTCLRQGICPVTCDSLVLFPNEKQTQEVIFVLFIYPLRLDKIGNEKCKIYEQQPKKIPTIWRHIRIPESGNSGWTAKKRWLLASLSSVALISDAICSLQEIYEWTEIMYRKICTAKNGVEDISKCVIKIE